jgi:hypothetical protein
MFSQLALKSGHIIIKLSYHSNGQTKAKEQRSIEIARLENLIRGHVVVDQEFNDMFLVSESNEFDVLTHIGIIGSRGAFRSDRRRIALVMRATLRTVMAMMQVTAFALKSHA